MNTTASEFPVFATTDSHEEQERLTIAKEDLIEALAPESNIGYEYVETLLDSALNLIAYNLAQGNRVHLENFGTLFLKKNYQCTSDDLIGKTIVAFSAEGDFKNEIESA